MRGEERREWECEEEKEERELWGQEDPGLAAERERGGGGAW